MSLSMSLSEWTRMDQAKASASLPRRSCASSIVALWLLPDVIASIRIPKLFNRRVTSASSALRSWVLVKPSVVSQEHSVLRVEHDWQTGRCPEHLTLLLRHSAHALLTGSGFFRLLVASAMALLAWRSISVVCHSDYSKDHNLARYCTLK